MWASIDAATVADAKPDLRRLISWVRGGLQGLAAPNHLTQVPQGSRRRQPGLGRMGPAEAGDQGGV